jgi:GAF domain-containing protein
VKKGTERLLRLERDVNRLLLNGDDTEATLVALLHTVCKSEGWAAGRYWRLDEPAGVLRIHAAWCQDGTRRRTLSEAFHVEGPGVGLAGEVLQTRRPLWVPDLGSDPRVLKADLPVEIGWKSALLGPVLWRGRVIGVIEFDAESILPPDEHLLEMLEAIGMQIGNFCVRAVAFDRLRESEERYAKLVGLTAIGTSHADANGHARPLTPQADASPTSPARAPRSTGSTRRLRPAGVTAP